MIAEPTLSHPAPTEPRTEQGTALGGAVRYRLARQVEMAYEYVNNQPGPLSLWLSLPPDLPMQRNVRLEGLSPTPREITSDGHGINRLAFFQLAPGEALRFTLRADLYDASYDPPALGSATLSPEAREQALRSSPLIRVTDEVRAEARRIVGDATTPLEQARRLFVHLVRHYRYRYPPAARGSEAMRRSHQGDCGEYSFLYAAWCRALGIPCRVLVGTFAHGRFAAHVWNEVFIEGVGWLPADSSILQTPLRLPILADLDWALQRLGRRFGRLSGDRLAFSIDPDVVLLPPFVERPVPERADRMMMGGHDLAWGFESLHGAAPYLQPIYLRFSETRLPLKTEDYLGAWRFADPLPYRLGTWLLWGGFLIGALGTLLGLLDIEGFDLPKAAGYTLANIIFIRRTGIRWWKLGLLALFLLELIGLIGERFLA